MVTRAPDREGLGTVRAEMQASVIRTELRHFEISTGMNSAPLSTWSLETGTETLQLERALLAIDLFPRGALLLMVFEKLSLDDAAIFLNADKELVTTAKLIGLFELARNLPNQGRMPAVFGLSLHPTTEASA